MGVARFEDLRVWQGARSFCAEISSLLRTAKARSDYALCDQLNAAALSTMANIAEGFLRHRDKEFGYFLRIAGASNGEARALLHVARARDYLDDAELDRLVEMTNVIGRMIRVLERTLHS